MTFPTLQLRTGDALPSLGLGMWKVDSHVAPSLVKEAVAVGYRHFDCACDYGNEAAVGQGLQEVLRDGRCTRDDLWVTSKLWNTYHRPRHVRGAIEKSLADLKLDYLDLYLIHFPISLKFVPMEDRYPPGWFFDPDASNPKMEPDPVPISDTWGAMEELVEAGLAKTVGVCNFGCSLLRDMLSYASIPPAVLQVESHPYLVQEKLLRFCKEQQIAYTAFSPLGALSYFELGMAGPGESLLQLPVVREAAKRHGKSPAQILLRWGIQRKTAVIPKTSKPERLQENADIFDFTLSESEMDDITQLDRRRRFNDPGDFCETLFNTFFPIYE
ncbi:MAG: aldo/keto reductase [Planctomycetota bacterium]